MYGLVGEVGIGREVVQVCLQWGSLTTRQRVRAYWYSYSGQGTEGRVCGSGLHTQPCSQQPKTRHDLPSCREGVCVRVVGWTDREVERDK